MTTVRQILTRAGRFPGLSSEGQIALTAYDGQVGVDILNAMLREFRGQEIGPQLKRQWSASAGDTAISGGLYSVSITTPCRPKNGDRIGVIGARTVTANTGDTIEGASSVTTTATTTWFYREDLGDWKKEQDLTLDSAQPLSTDADEALIMCLVARWTAEYSGGEMSPNVVGIGQKGRARIRQLYGYRPLVCVDTSLMRGLAQRRNWPSAL